MTGACLLYHWSNTDSESFVLRDRAALVVEPDAAYQDELFEKERRFVERLRAARKKTG